MEPIIKRDFSIEQNSSIYNIKFDNTDQHSFTISIDKKRSCIIYKQTLTLKLLFDDGDNKNFLNLISSVDKLLNLIKKNVDEKTLLISEEEGVKCQIKAVLDVLGEKHILTIVVKVGLTKLLNIEQQIKNDNLTKRVEDVEKGIEKMNQELNEINGTGDNNDEKKVFNLNLDKAGKAQICCTISQYKLINALISNNIENFLNQIQKNDENQLNIKKQSSSKINLLIHSELQDFFVKTNKHKCEDFSLNLPELKLFKEWIEFTFKLDCLFIASKTRDGFMPSTFHQIAGKKTNILVIFTTETYDIKNKKVVRRFGGFTPLSFNAAGFLVKDETSKTFIFSLDNKIRFKLKPNNINAIYDDKGHGPSFGNGYDILIKPDCNKNSNSSSILGGSFDIYEATKLEDCKKEAKEYLAGNANFRVTEMEVFQVVKQ